MKKNWKKVVKGKVVVVGGCSGGEKFITKKNIIIIFRSMKIYEKKQMGKVYVVFQ